VERALGVVRLGDAAGRRATELSGGEQQRLALARALVVEPPLLLLDEPLSNLDARLRDEMRFELKRVQGELGITCLYVTHDQSEALAISTEVAIMRDGRIEQAGAPQEIYERPATRFVADFIGAANVLDGIVEQVRNGTCDVRTAAGVVRAAARSAVTGQNVALVVRPENVLLTADGDGWPGTVVAEAFLGETVERVVRVGPLELRAHTSPTALLPAEVTVSLPPEACLVLVEGDHAPQ
jgi:iron(III) transport system ATP-binding protein